MTTHQEGTSKPANQQQANQRISKSEAANQRTPAPPFAHSPFAIRHSRYLLTAILLAFALRLWRIDVQDIWWDEARNIDVALRPVTAILTAPELDIHPPGYFLLLHVWTGLAGHTAFATRFLSTWFGVLLLPLLFALGRRLGHPRAGLLAAWYAALSPFLIGEAQETRMYTLAFALLALGALFFWDLLLPRNGDCGATGALEPSFRRSCPRWLPLGLTMAAAALTHYATAFVLLAWYTFALALLALRVLRFTLHNRRCTGEASPPIRNPKSEIHGPPFASRHSLTAIRYLLSAAVLSLLLFLPQAPRAYRQIAPYGNPNLAVPTPLDYLRQLSQAYTVGIAAEGPLARYGPPFFALLLLTGLTLHTLRLTLSARRPPPAAHRPPSADRNSKSQIRNPKSQSESANQRISEFAIRHSPIPNPKSEIRNLLTANCYLLTATFLPIALYYAVLIRRATFAPRYISFVLPFLALLFGLALGGFNPKSEIQKRISESANRRTPAPPFAIRHSLNLLTANRYLLTAICYLLLALGIHADQYNPKYFREDTSGLARWLLQNTGPDDLVLIDVPYPLGFYYPRYSKDPNRPLPPEPADIAPAYYLFVDIHTVADRLNQLARGKTRVFWVQWYKSDTDPRGAVDYLLRKYGRYQGRTAFRGYTVDRYRVPPDAHYQLAPALNPTHADFNAELTLTAAALPQSSIPNPQSPISNIQYPIPNTQYPTPNTQHPVPVLLQWQRTGTPRAPYKASVRLLDPLGRLVGQDDRRLLNDRHLAPPYWAPGEEALNVYLIELPLGAPPGDYTLTVRLYDPADLTPLPLRGTGIRPAGVDFPLGRVTITRSLTFPPVTPIALTDAPIALVAYSLGRAEAAPGTVVPVHLLWVKQPAHARNHPLRVQLALFPVPRAHAATPHEPQTLMLDAEPRPLKGPARPASAHSSPPLAPQRSAPNPLAARFSGLYPNVARRLSAWGALVLQEAPTLAGFFPGLRRDALPPRGPQRALPGAHSASGFLSSPRRGALPLRSPQLQLPGVELPGAHSAPGPLSPWVTPPVPWDYPTDRWLPGEIVRGDLDWRLAPDTPTGVYTVRLTLLDAQERGLGSVDLGTLTVAGRPRTFDVPPIAHLLDPAPRFGDLAQLLGYDIDGRVQPGATLAITLTWRALGPAEADYKAFLHLLDPQGRLLTQEDHIPQRGDAPTTSWLPGEIIIDRYDLTLPGSLPPAPESGRPGYTLAVGFYDPDTMARLPRLDPSGQPVGDHITLPVR